MKDEYNFSSAKRGPVVPLPSHQTEVRLRLDNEVLDWLRERVNEAGGGDYLSMINVILRRQFETQVSRQEVYSVIAETDETPVVARQARVVEEVIVGKTATERTETVHLQRRK